MLIDPQQILVLVCQPPNLAETLIKLYAVNGCGFMMTGQVMFTLVTPICASMVLYDHFGL